VGVTSGYGISPGAETLYAWLPCGVTVVSVGSDAGGQGPSVCSVMGVDGGPLFRFLCPVALDAIPPECPASGESNGFHGSEEECVSSPRYLRRRVCDEQEHNDES
jgi:hypothetical protein